MKIKILTLIVFNLVLFTSEAQLTYDFGKYSTQYQVFRCFTAVDAQSNFYVANTFNGSVSIEPGNSNYNLTSNGGADFYVAKYNSAGIIQWVKQYSSSGGEILRDMEMDSQGNILVTGNFGGGGSLNTAEGGNLVPLSGGNNAFLIKITPNGVTSWARGFQDVNSSGYATGYGLDVDNENNIIFTGSFFGTIDLDPSSNMASRTAINEDIFIVKLNLSGSTTWIKNFGGSLSEIGYKVYCDNNNNIICTGVFLSQSIDFDPSTSQGLLTHNLTKPNDYDSYLVKLNSNGDFIWGSSFDDSFFYKITTDIDGKIYCTGLFSSTTDFDPTNGIYNLSAIGSSDIFTMKMNSSGNLEWVKQTGATGFNASRSIALDVFGNVYSVGDFGGTNVDFDPGSGSFFLTSNGERDFFIQKLSNTGDFLWAGSAGSINTELAWDITLDGNGKCYVVGTMQSSGDIDPTGGIDNRTGSGIFFVRLSNFTNTNPIAANTVVSASTLSDNGNTTPVVFQNQSGVISTVTPSGNNPIEGQITSKIWVNVSGVTNYINKTIEITPQTNPNTSSGKVTIYFTQAEFDDYNLTNSIHLPSNASDAIGKANLKIDKYSGISSDNSGTPNSYNSTPTIVDPDDNDIFWNSDLSRWEVSFNVVGFSGFFVKGDISPCSTTLILISTTDDYSSGTILKEANATTGTIAATNKLTGTANVTYRAGKTIQLEPGFLADSGVVFKTEFGGCN